MKEDKDLEKIILLMIGFAIIACVAMMFNT
jgi:hypothetical protein